MAVHPAMASEYDVLVYGATPAGISAALAAGRAGNRVLLVEPGTRLGGRLSQGIAHPGFTSFEARSGLYLEFCRRVSAHYAHAFGGKSAQLRACQQGSLGEPGVNLAVLEQMLAEVPAVEIRRLWSLEALKCSTNAPQDQPDPDRSAEVAVFVDDSGTKHTLAAHYFIDATYEGDLLAAAKVPYRVGREAQTEFSESLAPEKADDAMQAIYFQPVLTNEPGNRLPVPAPERYQRKEFVPILGLLKEGRIRHPFGTGPDAAFQTGTAPLPNHKLVLTDGFEGLVRLSLPGTQAGWADGDGGVAIRGGVERDTLVAPFSRLGLSIPRDRIRTEHRNWTLGLLFFLQTDSAVPAAFRTELAGWGFPADEFRDSVHFPEQPVVREARRMVGFRVFTQRDTECGENDARSVFSQQSVAVSDASLSSHFTQLDGSRFGGRVSGGFSVVVPPVQIPAGVLFPRHVDNLLVACAVGASHVGFGMVNHESVWMSLGEAAGHIAHLANTRKRSIHRVSIAAVQRRLHATGSATLYVSDVPPGHPQFEAVQWWGSVGGFHGLEHAPQEGKNRGIRGAALSAQGGGLFFEAFPGHAARTETVLDAGLAGRWALVAQASGIESGKLPRPDGSLTRGAWILSAYKLALELPVDR